MSTDPFYLTPMGDQVRYVANERVDLIDALAQGSLPLDSLGMALGALLGDAQGVLSPPVLVYGVTDGVHHIDVGPFQFYWQMEAWRPGSPIKDPGPRTVQGGSFFGDGHPKARRGMVITHDPEVDSQTSRVDISGVISLILSAQQGGVVPRNEKNYPYLWARPYLLATDEDTRKVFNEATLVEDSVSMATRLRVRVEFQVSGSRPSVPLDDDGAPAEAPWVCVGRFTHWTISEDESQALPTLSPLSVLDSWEIQDFLGEPGTEYFTSDEDTREAAGVPEGESGNEALNGLAPSPGATASISPMFGPAPAIASEDGYRTDGDVIGNKGQRSPVAMGLVQGMHLVRDVLRRHLAGEQVGDRRYPFWHIPKYGLVALSRMADTAVTSIALLNALLLQKEEALQGQIDALEQNTINAPQLLGWLEVNYDPNNEVEVLGGGLAIKSDGAYTLGNDGIYEAFFTIPVAQVGAVVVYPRKGPLEVYFGQTGLATYNSTKGGYNAIQDGQLAWPNPNNAQESFLRVRVRAQGPDHSAGDGTFVKVRGSFGVLVYGRAS